MKRQVILLLPLFLLCSQVEAAGLYRWVDENGKVHYSDSVPPRLSQAGHTELDSQGNKVEVVKAAKSKEQAAEEKWLAELEAKLQQKKQQQRRKDELLLNSYPTLKQFDRFYAERFEVLDKEHQQLKLLRGKLAREFERLDAQLKASKTKGAKKRVQGFIDINVSNTASYDKAIEQNLDEQAKIRREAQEQRKRLLFLLSRAK